MVDRALSQGRIAVAAILVTAAAVILVGSPAANAAARLPVFTYTSFDYPGANATFVAAINDSGAIVGEYDDDSGAHSYLRDPAGGFTTLPEPPGSIAGSTFVSGIDGANSVVGTYQDAAPPNGLHGFILDASLTFTIVDHPGSPNTIVTGISNAGDLVGTYTGQDGLGHAFLRDPSGAFVTVDIPGAISTEPHDVNSTRAVVGLVVTDGFRIRGFARSPTGEIRIIAVPGLPHGAAIANGISEAGEIVGRFARGSGQLHGYLRTRAGTFLTIDFPGASRTEAIGISAYGIAGNETDIFGMAHGWLAVA
jgi:hypothetical protein